ncbi:MAG: hypothetical protein B7C24_02285 [Bacteroidetes bacterium 4572_77]|nr:MAG: hypothetical protein B7C24_02285 [Bacteroidetes bacterium 4572_77]
MFKMKTNLALVFFLLFSQIAYSQVIYTDVDPDVTIDNFLNGYGIDFDHNNKIDLHVSMLDNVGVWVMMLIPDSDADHTSVIYDGEEASILEEGDVIASSSNWYQLGQGWGGLLYGYWENDGEYGNWIGAQEDKYLGIQFEIDENFYYGWIYLSTEVFAYDQMQFTIQAFAYESQVGEPIIAGDMGNVGLEDNLSEKSCIYPNPTRKAIYLDRFSEIERIQVYNGLGVLLMEHNNDSKELDISVFEKGNYFLKIFTKDRVFVEKVIKQ